MDWNLTRDRRGYESAPYVVRKAPAGTTWPAWRIHYVGKPKAWVIGANLKGNRELIGSGYRTALEARRAVEAFAGVA